MTNQAKCQAWGLLITSAREPLNNAPAKRALGGHWPHRLPLHHPTGTPNAEPVGAAVQRNSSGRHLEADAARRLVIAVLRFLL